MSQKARDALQNDLRQMIAARLHVRARSFRGAVRRAGRLLPREARQAAAEISALDTRMAHPKLAARTDPALITRAAERFRKSLSAYPPGAQAAKARALLMAEIGFRIAVLIALGLAFLHWQTGG